MLSQIEATELFPEPASLGISCRTDAPDDRPSQDPSDILLKIFEHAIILEDLGKFLRKAAEILRESYDFDLVQIWTMGQRQEELILSSSVPRILTCPIIGKTIPGVIEECRRKNLMPRDDNSYNEQDKDSTHRAASNQLILPLRYRQRLMGLLSVESSNLDSITPEQSAVIEKASFVISAAFDKFKANARASRSYEYLQAILNSASNLAILSTDSQGYIYTGSSGIEAVFQLPLQSILGHDIITLFTDEKFRRDLVIYMAKGNAEVFSKNRLEQSTEKGTFYLDVSFQRMNPIENNPVGFLCLAIDVTANVILQQKLEALSLTDDLTGLSNRRQMMSVLSNEIKRSRRFHHTFSLCFFDLDGFKKYNDSKGHLSGDKALINIANLMQISTRVNVDTCYRFGGDELAILMPETSAQNAIQPIERILAQLCEIYKGAITASVGIVEYDPALKAESMMELADKAMYQAKAGGGNKVVIARE
jgi:diguanylate cyclase (GGDEF)-like protein